MNNSKERLNELKKDTCTRVYEYVDGTIKYETMTIEEILHEINFDLDIHDNKFILVNNKNERFELGEDINEARSNIYDYHKSLDGFSDDYTFYTNI